MCPGSDYHILIERYDPRSSDPVKALYNIKQTSGQRKAYLKVWAKYLFRYPSVHIQAAINNSHGICILNMEKERCIIME